MIAIVVLLVVTAGFFIWDRSSPASAVPDKRMVGIGIALLIVGALGSFRLWAFYGAPLLVLLLGATLIVVGRHR